jgi:oligopeptide transport system substrate-binding protein
MKIQLKKAAGGAMALAIGLTGAVTLSSCGEENKADTASSETAAPSIIKVYGCEPQNPLVTTNTTETCGGNPLDLMYSGLIDYDKDGNPVNDLAKDIKSDDSQNYTITLKDGLKFSNGEPITAKSFVNAWNYGALVTNAQGSEDFFNVIKGYEEVSAVDANEDPAPTAQTLSGLKVVDDKTFTVELTEPSSTFQLRLGYTAFMPLPESAFDANGVLIDTFGENPVTSGAYKLAKWTHDESIELVPNENYSGQFKAKNGGVTFVAYTGAEAAYSDVQSGSLDVIESVPASQKASFQNDDTVVPYVQPGTSYQGIEFPYYLAHFGNDKEGQLRRAAISRAIDRKTIIDTISNGLGVNPVGWAPENAVINGTVGQKLEGAEVLTFDATEAKKLWAEADAISPFSGDITLTINGDGGGKSLFDAIANQIKNNLGVECTLTLTPDFKTLLKLEASHTATGAFRNGWQADYPSIENYLQPLYITGAGNNYPQYTNKEFDALMAKGSTAKTLTEANKFFHQAEEILIKDLPSIPLYDNQLSFVTAKNVKNVSATWKSVPDYRNITK